MLKLSTINELRKQDIIELVECDKSEKEVDPNVVKDNSNGKWYRIEQDKVEIIIELLTKCHKALWIIADIMIGISILIGLVIIGIVFL